jgi:AcrR family transcriptional regulator
MSDDLLFINDPQPTRADAVENRRVLLRTARRLFAQQDVETITMTQLAQAAGVGKGTLYRHFNNKAEVCYALLDDEQRQLQNETLQRMRATTNPTETMRWFLEGVVDFVVRNDQLLAAGLQEGNVTALTFPAHAWWHTTIRGLLDQMGITGDQDYLSDTLYVMVNVETIHYQLHTRGYTRHRIVDGILMLFARLTNRKDYASSQLE